MSGCYYCISGEHLWLPYSLAYPALMAVASVGTRNPLPMPLVSVASQHQWNQVHVVVVLCCSLVGSSTPLVLLARLLH